MAALSGTASSVVYVTGGTTLVGGIGEWSFNVSHSPVETTAFGEEWRAYIPSIRDATFSFSGFANSGDAGQTSMKNAFLGGSACAFRLYDSPTTYWNVGTAYFESMGPSISFDGRAEVSYSARVSGPVTFV